MPKQVQHNENKAKIVVSGYYGHGNFGDELILKVIKKTFEPTKVTVLSKNPNLLKNIAECDLFISGGGSLLQDVTSLRSLLYYLGLLFLAILLKKKTVIYSQGIGPINSYIGKKLTAWVLKKVNIITVRDKESADFLASLGIDSIVTSDPVWALDYTPNIAPKDKINIGIQLRKWNTLDDEKLKSLADAVNSTFNGQNVILNLISLQDKNDAEVLSSFSKMTEGPETRLLTGLSLDETIDHLSNMDYLISMRYHSCLISAKYGVPFLAIAYDPKVESLAKESASPYVCVKDMDFSVLSNALKYLISEKETLKCKLKEISLKNAKKSYKITKILKIVK